VKEDAEFFVRNAIRGMGRKNDAGRPHLLLTTRLEATPDAQKLDLSTPATRSILALVKLN
jgi:hypothetical protein